MIARAQITITDLDEPSEIVIGTQTSSTSVWTGVANLASLKDGQQVVYWLPVASTGTAVTLNLTLHGGATTGAIPCYYGGTTRITTHYAAGNSIHLTYRVNAKVGSSIVAQGWWADANYNSDTYDRMQLTNAVVAKEAILSSRFIVSDAGGYFHLAPGVAFDVTKPILWSRSTVAAGASSTYNYLTYPNCTLVNNLAGFSGTNQKTCYIQGVLKGDTFTPTAALFTTAVPDEQDGFIYIALGLMVSTNQVYLYPEHPMYAFLDGSFKSLNQVAYEMPENLTKKVDELMQHIDVKKGEILSTVSDTYTTKGEYETVTSTMASFAQQLNNKFSWTIEEKEKVESALKEASETSATVKTISTYMSFDANGLSIGKSGNPFTFRVINDQLGFYDNNTKVAYMFKSKLHVSDAEIERSMDIGNFTFEPQLNGNLSFVYKG